MQDCCIHLAQKLQVPCLQEFPVRNVQVESPGDVDGVAMDESVAVVGVVSSVLVSLDCAIDSGNSNHHAPNCIILNHNIYSDVIESKGVREGGKGDGRRKKKGR